MKNKKIKKFLKEWIGPFEACLLNTSNKEKKKKTTINCQRKGFKVVPKLIRLVMELLCTFKAFLVEALKFPSYQSGKMFAF